MVGVLPLTLLLAPRIATAWPCHSQEWADCTAQQAYEKLRSADVQVTNQADKDVQLPKILELDQRVTGIANDIGLHREPSPEPRPAAYASQQWCVWDQDPDLIIKLSQTL